MFTASSINDVEYFKETMVYYNGKDVKIEDTKMKLHGKLATRLGIDEVDFKQLEYLANGFSLNGKKELIQGAGEPRKIAYDNTICMSKDVSIAYSMADEIGKKEILETFEKSIHETMKYKEENFTTSKLKNEIGERKSGAEIAYTIIYHFEDREGQPHLHGHILELNLTSDSEGNISSQDNQKTFKNQKVLGSMFRNTFYTSMIEKGYAFERNPVKPDFLKLKGIGIDLMIKMSRRKELVLKYIEQKYGVTNTDNLSTKDIQNAFLATRKNKEHFSPSYFFESWKNFYKKLNLNTKEIFDNLKLQEPTNFEEIKLNTKDILSKLTDKNATFSIEDMTSEYLIAYAGNKTNAEILQIVQNEIDNNKEIIKVKDCCLVKPTEKMIAVIETMNEAGLIHNFNKINLDSFDDVRSALNSSGKINKLDSYKVQEPETRYTTLTTVNNELSTIESCVGYRKDSFKLDGKNVKEEIEKINQSFREQTKNPDARLSNEQLNMIYQCTETKDGVSIINGAPGSGKSSGCLVVVKAHEKQGYEVIGTALSSKATDGLSKSAEINKTFNLHNLCSDLESGKLVFNQKTLLVIDEAGQLDSKTTATIMKHIKTAENNGKEIKVVMLGDYKQLPSVNASNPFKMLIEKLGVVYLNEINRQRARKLEDGTTQDGRLFYIDEKGYKQNVVHLLGDGENLKALQVYKENGKLHMFDTKIQKQDFIAKTFADFKDVMKDKAVIVATNNEMDIVNKSIRQELIKRGVIDNQEYKVLSKWVTDEGSVDFKEYNFSVNDRIVFKKNNKEKEIKNGNLATITKIVKMKNGAVIINAITDDGMSIKLDTSNENENQIKSGYAMTAHISQGLTINQTITSFSDSLHTTGMHVAGSRHRYNNLIVLSKADIQDFERRKDMTVLEKNDDLITAIGKMDKILKAEKVKENAIQYKLENLPPDWEKRLQKLKEHKPQETVINHDIQRYLNEQREQSARQEIEDKKITIEIEQMLNQSKQQPKEEKAQSLSI